MQSCGGYPWFPPVSDAGVMTSFTHDTGINVEPGHRHVTKAARGNARHPTLPRAVAFWLVAGVLFLLFFAAAAPSPLYGVYQARWRFSATTLTVVFAAYALLLLVTLLVFGSVSDYLGRRRVILVGLAMAAGACGLFLAADGVGLLFAARALHGAAVGTASSALGAALIDLQPEGSRRAPVVTTAAALSGLAVGGLGASVLVQYAPAPTHLIWWLLLGADLAAAVAVLAMPETTPGRPGALASLRPRVAVPRQARGTFAMALPCLIAVWMTSGFYLALGPSLAAHVLHSPDLLWGGLVIFLLNGVGTAATIVARRASGPAAMLAGCLFLLTGTAVTLAAIENGVGSHPPRRYRGGGLGLRRGDAGCLPDHKHPGGTRSASRPDRRLLHRVLHGIQYPRRDRRGGYHAFRPAADRPGLLHGDRRTRRGRSGQLDLPRAFAPRPAS